MALTDYVPTSNASGTVAGQGILQESETATTPLGTKLTLNDGRVFVYCQAGEALAALEVAATPGYVSTEENLAITTASKGDLELSITVGSTIASSANLYAGGYVIIDDDTGEGQILKIRSHPTFASAAIVFKMYDPLRVDLGADATVTLVKNPHKAVIQQIASGGTELGVAIGVPLIIVQDAYFFWAQTRGICGVLNDANIAIGAPCMRGSVAGSLATHDSSFKDLGGAHHSGVDTEYSAVMLRI